MINEVKSSMFYKLMKTTEAIAMIALPAIFVLLGWFNLYPAIALVAAYIALNLTQYSDKALWQTRDKVVESADNLKEEVKDLKEEIKGLKTKL